MLGIVMLAFVGFAADGRIVSDAQTVVFLGDSITCYGAKKPDGYVKLVVSGLAANGINVKWFGAGIAGQKAHHMKDRFEKDVLARKPDLVTISAGVNDVWFPGADCTLDKFRADMQDMIARAKAAGIRVVLLTPTSAYANEGNDPRIKAYADCVQELASANGVALADTRKAFRELVDDPKSPKLDKQGRKATVDGVHMAPAGNRAMAREVLRALGLNDAERAKAEETWNTKPFCPASVHVAVPYPAYRALETAADAHRCGVESSIVQAWNEGLAAMVADPKLETSKAAEPARPAAGEHKAEIVYVGDRTVYYDQSCNSGLARQIELASEVSGKDIAVSVIPSGTPALNNLWDEKLAARKPSCLVVSTYGSEIFGLKADVCAADVKKLAEKAAAAGTRVVLLTTRPTKNPMAENTFNQAIRGIADGKNILVLDQRAILDEMLKRRAANPYASVTATGFLLASSANLELGRKLLPMLGFTEEEVARTYAEIDRRSDFADVWAEVCLSFRDYDALLATAGRLGTDYPTLLEMVLRRGVALQAEKLSSSGASAAKSAGERLAACGIQAKITKGYAGSCRYSFTFEGFNVYFDEPANPQEGRKWMWCMKWPNAFAERTGQIDGVARGYYYVYIDDLKWMSPEGTKVAKRFHDFLVEKLGFAQKAFLIGMSWGGFYSTRYAANYPEDVAAVYLDAPLMTFAQFNLGSYPSAKIQWGALEQGDWGTDKRMPVNLADKIAKSGIPVLLLYGGADTVVVPAVNCERFVSAYKAAGGTRLQVFRDEARGHHPHGFDGADGVRKVVDFFEGKLSRGGR